MQLPVMPPVAPMLAKAVPDIPDGASYEPKWDGFRSVVFRDGDEVEIGSRNERPMTRYFPELVEAFKAELPARCVIDGEIVVAVDGRLEFEVLQQRIHPADSRVRRLAAETPASFVAFDLLALGDEDLTKRPFVERRALLVEALAGARAPVHVTPATTDRAVAERWFEEFEGAGLDGVVAKPLTVTYQPDKRVMFKIKHARTADCVVAGYRLHKSGPDLIGSLMLGLYTDDGSLASVGVIGAFPMARRRELFTELHDLVTTFEGIRGTGLRLNRIRKERATHGRRRPRAGTPARTCPSCRCGPSSWSRCATTRWRVRGSGTRPSSTAGGRIARPSRAPSTSSSGRSRSSSLTSCPASGHETIGSCEDLVGVRLPCCWAAPACCTWSVRRSTSHWCRAVWVTREPGSSAPGWPKLPVLQAFSAIAVAVRPP